MTLFDKICEVLPDNPGNIAWRNNIWCNGEEIMCRTPESCEDIVEFIEIMSETNGKGIDVHTGYYDPDEDERNGETDYCTGWYFIYMD